MARLDPDNRTGTGGDDVLSRNFSWNLPLVGMTGRSGLNLGLSLSYNSLVWTRSDSYITYDADNGYPTPGFRLGFPVVYGQHVNSQTGTYGYLMLMPSGSRVELRKVGSTNVFEAADSSYLQLTDNGYGNLLVRSTDGTQLSYTSTDNGFRCTQVKDRNGNYLSVEHNSAGRLVKITDTLGREFNFNYDENDNLTSISQTRGASQYTWVTFGYRDLELDVNFTGLTIIGTENHTTLPVLSQVGLPDGSYYKFAYNTWGQVYKITNYAADSNPQTDSHPLNYVSYNLPLTSSTAQTDCPRFTQRKDWAENWNNSAEAVTYFIVPIHYIDPITMADGTQVNLLSQKLTPAGVYYNVYTRSSGWDEGLPVLVNTYDSGVALQRQELTTRTQDNTSVEYMLNPRVTESNIYDPSGNHKRTTISYSSSFGLPTEVKEYAANATTVLRTTQTTYDLRNDYTSRRIIGLPSQKIVCDAADCTVPISRVTFVYDESGEFLVQQGTPIRHDATNYGSSFTWRGNNTRVIRWDAINTSESVESKVGYNTTGSPIFTRSPTQTSDTQSNVTYTDSFSDNENRNTLAYPAEATIKDTVGISSTLVPISNKVKYNFFTGAVTSTEGPPPAGASQGPIVTYTFDTIGRLYYVTNSVNSASTINYYVPSSNSIQTYTTITGVSTPALSSKIFDGAGRLRATAADHPNSIGGYVAQITVFDVMGRVSATSNPTEIYGSWQPAGDDAAGWVYSYQTYDWRGRPRVTTNQDGSTKEATYDGCGCAGSDEVTIRDEVNRKSKAYNDVLGRVIKAEELNTGDTVFRTTTNVYNGRDQVTTSTVQAGSSGAGQVSTMAYDGYGRLSTSHSPIQSENTVTTYTYNNGDEMLTKTDARGVVATFTYNNRHLTTGISYANTAPSGVPETTLTEFTYDAAGNRTSMTDSLGSVSYSYNALSQMTSESRNFSNVGTSTLTYTYNLAGQLTSVTDPWSAQVGYTRDFTGRLTAVTGSGYPTIPQESYASNFTYRASGALNGLTYGNDVTLELSYSNRMQVSKYKMTTPSTQTPSKMMDIDYSYGADGRLKLSTDHKDASLDRAYKYDQVGRLVEAFTASEARSWVQTGSIGTTVDGPYRQAYTLDAWDNMLTKWGRSYTGTYSRTQTVNDTYSATTGRNNAWTYDADGRMLSDGSSTVNIYDEAGGLREVSNSTSGTFFTQDGDGQKAKMVVEGNATHYLHSSVLGQTIAEIDTDGSRKYGFVYADGQLIATQVVGAVFWQHTDASGRSRRTTMTGGHGQLKDEVDPMDVKLDRPGLNNHNTAPGGGGKSAGGAEARVASLMDLNFCDFAGILVPCGIRESFRELVGQSPRELGLFWEHGWWSGASHGTAFTYFSKNSPFRVMDLLRKAKPATPKPLPLPTLKRPGRTTKEEAKRGWEAAANVGNDEQDGDAPQDGPQNDCLVFAAMVDIFASEAGSDFGFVGTLYNKFRDRNDHSFSGRGFKDGFVDRTGESPNQVRHAAAAIAAGYAGGLTASALPRQAWGDVFRSTLDAFNSREKAYSYSISPTGRAHRILLPTTPGQQADLNLNAVAVPIGLMLGVGVHNRKEIGNYIRREICNP